MQVCLFPYPPIDKLVSGTITYNDFDAKEFDTLLNVVNGAVAAFDLEPLGVPRQRRPPVRLSRDDDACEAMSLSMHYCSHFFVVIGTAPKRALFGERWIEKLQPTGDCSFQWHRGSCQAIS